VLKTPDLAATIAKLRGDKALYFTSREEILAAAQKALDRAKAATAEGVLHAPEDRLRDAGDPRVRGAVLDDSRTTASRTTTAASRASTSSHVQAGDAPAVRARGADLARSPVPGHHTRSRCRRSSAPRRRSASSDGSTAYIEGWALYTERLADELGLYSSDLDRIGKLSYDAWRASRLVVDTGLHAMGWTRAQAEGSCASNTAA